MHIKTLSWLGLLTLGCQPSAGFDTPTTFSEVDDLGEALHACAPMGEPVSSDASSRLLAVPSHGLVYVTDVDNHAIVRMPMAGGTPIATPVGAAPGRLARLGDRIYATLPETGELAVLAHMGRTLTLLETVKVGDEPFGIVSDGADALYVALTLEDRVVELDPTTLAERASWDVEGQPRWLALRRDTGSLFVASALEGRFTEIQLDSGEQVDHPMPRAVRELETAGGPEFELTPRITGDPAISPDGSMVTVPTLYVDHTSTVGSPGDARPIIENVPISNPGYYAPPKDNRALGRFTPSIVTLSLTSQGKVRPGLFRSQYIAPPVEIEEYAVFFENSDGSLRANRDGRIDATQLQVGVVRGTTPTSGYPTAVRYDAVGHLLIAVEGAGLVLATCADPAADGHDFLPRGSLGRPGVFSHFDYPGFGAFYAGEGAQAIDTTPDGAVYTYAFLDRSIRWSAVAAITDAVDRARAEGQTHGSILPVRGVLEHSQLSDDMLIGRHLFHTTRDDMMVTAGASVSCATCHFEGRTDGITWTFPEGPRQTPALGGIGETAPYTWTDAVPTVRQEVVATAMGRMLGRNLPTPASQAVADFLVAQAPTAGTVHDEASVERGEAIFERADTGCATCHTGAALTDQSGHPVYGESAIDTPSLRGIVATPPYLHDGSARTLREVLLTADAGGMGRAAHLTEAELDDLVAFLRSL